MFALPVIHVFDGKGECEIIPVSNFDLLYPGPFQHQLFIEGKHSTISYEDPNITAAQAREMQNSQKGQAYRRAKEEYECKRPAYETKRASNTGFFGIIKNFFLRPPKAPKPPVFYEFERNSYLRATGTFELSGWGTQSEIRQAKEISIPINSAEVTLRGQNGSRLVIEKFTNTQTVYIIPLGIFKRNLLNMSNHPVWSERVHLFFQGRRDSLLSATTTGWGQPRLEIRDDQGRIISPESFPFIHALYEHRDEVDRYLVFLSTPQPPFTPYQPKAVPAVSTNGPIRIELHRLNAAGDNSCKNEIVVDGEVIHDWDFCRNLTIRGTGSVALTGSLTPPLCVRKGI